MPKVSVIIPTYNRALLVQDAIESVLHQTYPDFEIIVIDDGSTDATQDVLEAYHARMKYLRIPHSGNPATVRNTGLSVAEGEYAAFLDSDDQWLPSKLERQIPFLESDPEIGLVCSNAFVKYQGQDAEEQLYLRPDQGFSGLLTTKLLEQNFIITSTTVIRRAILVKTGTFSQLPELTALEDYDLWLRISTLSKICFIPEALAIYSEHPEQSLRFTRRPSQHWQGQLAILSRLQGFLLEHNLIQEIKPELVSECALRYKKKLVKALWEEHQPIQAFGVSMNLLVAHPRQVIEWIYRKLRSKTRAKKNHTKKPLDTSRNDIYSKQDKLRLHLGCGETYLQGYVNIDLPPDRHSVQIHTRADVYADITELSYPSKSVNEIRLHHVLEHFDRPTALRLLIEWYEWLEDGGMLVIETPDFELSARTFLKSNAENSHKILRHIFGSHEATWATHQDGWYREKLQLYLTSLGFHALNFYRTEWKGTFNIRVEARKTTPFMDREEQFRVAEVLLRHSLIDETASEQRLLQIWLEKLRSKK